MRGFNHTVFYDYSLYKMHYIDTSPNSKLPVVICLPGFTRNSKDFFPLAQSLKKHFRFVMPDLLGRGKSDYLANYKGYNFENYLQNLTSLIEKINCEEVHIIGTSLGGLLGICLASLKNTKVKSLFLNDISPKVSRISTLYLLRRFRNLRYHYSKYDEILKPATKMGENFVLRREREKLKIIANNVIKKTKDGYTFTWDKNINQLTFWQKIFGVNIDLTHQWQNLKCPAFLLWGERSVFVDKEKVADMHKNCGKYKMHDQMIKGVGHAPSLMGDEQTKIVQTWLQNNI